MALRGSVGRRYARALFDIAVDANDVEGIARALGEVAATYGGSAELRQVLENPIFSLKEKQAVLDRLLSATGSAAHVRRFVMLLLERRRIAILPAIAQSFAELADRRQGRVRAELVSARGLDAATVAEIQRALEKRLGKTVVLETRVDPALIGGVVARAGSLVIDGSLRTRLQDLGKQLLN